ncbi:hypothetical protein GIB67_033091 [Kingdonia uniflora]|uniref:Aminotransferase-like plant mobile domain-containing protein n=1 Tax=Kingdonia uniflora TaxID=39325 RepID=A0A7J7MYT2_9MAGN|nr:hypothetical protein GIB67_033091 [Kingdonia uniflora]
MPPKGRGKLPTTRGRKIVPTASVRKRLNEERDDPSHPNYNNPPRVPAKRRKTRSTRVPLRDSSISGSLPQDKDLPSTEVLPERNSEQEAGENCPRDPSLLTSFATHHAKALVLGQTINYRIIEHSTINYRIILFLCDNDTWVSILLTGPRIGAISYKYYNFTLITAFTERWHPETNSFHFKWGEMTITLEDVSRLIGLRVDGDLTVVKGAWGSLAVKEMWRKCMYLPDSVYPDLKVGGQGISLSLKKMEDLFAGKVGTNVHDSASASSIRLSSHMVGKAYMLYVLGSFLFPTKKGTDVSVKYLSFFQDQHLPGIPTRNESGAPEFCTRWCWSKTTSAQTGSVALTIFREALNSYKVEDVIFDPYVEKREDKHMFEEVASFTVSFTKLCPDAVNLAEDDDCNDGRVLGDRCGVSQRENDEVPQNQNEGGGGPTETTECAFFMEATRRMQADIEAKNLANSICEKKLSVKTLECETNKKLLKDLTLECESTKKILEDQRLECESNKKLVEDLRMQLAAKMNETETLGKYNDKLMEEVYVHQIEVPLPLNIVLHPEENVGEAEMWKQKYEELHTKFEEAQRRLSEIDRNGVWCLTLKSAIEGGDFEDPEDPTYEKLGRQFMKLLIIAQEGPKGEYEDDIILSGREEYQEMIDSRMKKIDHKTNLRQSLFQPFNWFQLDIRDVERDGNTAFRVAASYAYQSQMKFSNVKVSLCTLMTKKSSYWKGIYSQMLDVAYNDLGERRYETLLRAICWQHITRRWPSSSAIRRP